MEEFRSSPFEKRVHESKRLESKHPDRVPVLVQPGNDQTPKTDTFKYLVPKTTTVGQFVDTIRKKTKLKSCQALFVFVNGVLPPTSSSMIQVYQEHREDDGFLYVTYTLENTFG